MVTEIYKLKNQFITLINQHIADRGIDRIDVKEMGELVDMVKDLAEAEKECWEASYYRAITNAMEGSSESSPTGRNGYGFGGTVVVAPSDHTDSLVDQIGKEYQRLNPNEKMMMKNKILTTIGSL